MTLLTFLRCDDWGSCSALERTGQGLSNILKRFIAFSFQASNAPFPRSAVTCKESYILCQNVCYAKPRWSDLTFPVSNDNISRLNERSVTFLGYFNYIQYVCRISQGWSTDQLCWTHLEAMAKRAIFQQTPSWFRIFEGKPWNMQFNIPTG